MLSALQMIGSIDEAFVRVQRQTDTVHGQMNDLSGRLLEVRKQEGEAYRRLAQVRLGLGDEDPLIQTLVQLDANVRAARQRTETAAAELDAEISALEAEAQTLRAQRALAADVVSQRQSALEAAAQAAREHLAATEPYRQQREAAQNAAQTAAAAESKTRQAEADRVEKGKPYEADDLFQYLWARGYGTPAYDAGILTRMGDRWVARFIGFDKARASFAMLNEIPRRLDEHARRQRARATVEAERLTALETAALEAGEAGARHAELEEAEARVDAIDEQIEANGAAMVAAQARRAQVLAGDDPATRAATAVIVDALRRQELRTLRDQARRTEPDTDDAAVRELEALEAEEQQILADLDEAKARQDQQQRELEKIETLRRDYRRRGYNRGSFDSAAGAMLGTMLGEVLGGAIGRDTFWGEVGRHHRPSHFPGGWGGGGGGGGGGDFHTGGGF